MLIARRHDDGELGARGDCAWDLRRRCGVDRREMRASGNRLKHKASLSVIGPCRLKTIAADRSAQKRRPHEATPTLRESFRPIPAPSRSDTSRFERNTQPRY